MPAIFDWSHRTHARARNLVGVVETPALSLEIVPKVDQAAGEGEPGLHAADNLIHMLSVARDVRTHLVGAAGLQPRRIHLLDVFVRPFAVQLLDELLKGMHRDYSRYEEELPHVRGQILLHAEMRRPPWCRHRVSLRFDEFDENSIINQTLKAASSKLARIVRDQETASLLARSMDELGSVADRVPSRVEMSSVHFDRINERFAPLFQFARRVLLGDSPTLRPGELQSFSVVFPMDVLFEEYVARMLVRHAVHLGLKRPWVHPQGRGRRKWLLRGPAREYLRLKPDVVVDRDGEVASVILDTKWKRLRPDTASALNGVEAGDIYQLVAYATRYECEEAVLVFPRTQGVSEKGFDVPGIGSRIRLSMIDVSRDLAKDISGVQEDLRRVVHGE